MQYFRLAAALLCAGAAVFAFGCGGNQAPGNGDAGLCQAESSEEQRPIVPDSGKFKQLRGGMDEARVTELMGKPSVSRTGSEMGSDYRADAQDWKELLWDDDQIVSFEPVVSGAWDNGAVAVASATFYRGKLVEAACMFASLTEESWEKLRAIVDPAGEARDTGIPDDPYLPIHLINIQGSKAFSTFGAVEIDLTMSPNGFCSLDINYGGRWASSGQDSESDGIGDENGDGVIDEKDWEIAWKNYLNEKLD